MSVHSDELKVPSSIFLRQSHPDVRGTTFFPPSSGQRARSSSQRANFLHNKSNNSPLRPPTCDWTRENAQLDAQISRQKSNRTDRLAWVQGVWANIWLILMFGTFEFQIGLKKKIEKHQKNFNLFFVPTTGSLTLTRCHQTGKRTLSVWYNFNSCWHTILMPRMTQQWCHTLS